MRGPLAGAVRPGSAWVRRTHDRARTSTPSRGDGWVDTADHVAVDKVEHRVRESDTVTEILRVLLQIGQVLFQRHGSRPGIGVVVEVVGDPGLAWICSMLDIHAA
jgi:hypothetical protein